MKKSKKPALLKNFDLASGAGFVNALTKRLEEGQPSLVIMLSPKLSPWSMTAHRRQGTEKVVDRDRPCDILHWIRNEPVSRLFILTSLFKPCLTSGLNRLCRGEYMIGLNTGSVDDICWVSFDDAIKFSKLRKQFGCVALR
jgi:hypothetical protein